MRDVEAPGGRSELTHRPDRGNVGRGASPMPIVAAGRSSTVGRLARHLVAGVCAVAAGLFGVACVGRGSLEPPPFVAAARADDWSPREAGIEWWYVAVMAPEEGVAVHFAFFKGRIPPEVGFLGLAARALYPHEVHVAHLGVTDLGADEHTTRERTDVPFGRVCVADAPLRLRIEDWSLVEDASDGSFRLDAGSVHVRLAPLRARTFHPPGFVGEARTGRLGYQSITRLACCGTVAGRTIHGLAWMDHQWGDLAPGRTADWDWLALQTDDGSDVMVMRLRTPEGEPVAVSGSWTDAAGRTVALHDARFEPTQWWTSSSGRAYPVAWRVHAEGLALDVRAERAEQELLSRTTGVAYWEGPVRCRGRIGGTTVRGAGMGETLSGAWKYARASCGVTGCAAASPTRCSPR